MASKGSRLSSMVWALPEVAIDGAGCPARRTGGLFAVAKCGNLPYQFLYDATAAVPLRRGRGFVVRHP